MGATEEILKILKQIEKNSDNIDQAILNIGEAAKGLAQTTKLINEGILSRENLRHLNSVLSQMNKAGEQLPATMAAMKDTVSDARRIIAGAEEKLNSLDPAIKEIPPHADRPAQGIRANRLRHGGRAQKPGLPGAAHVRCALPRQCPGIHPQPEGLRHPAVPEPERAPGQAGPPRRFFRKPPLRNAHNSW